MVHKGKLLTVAALFTAAAAMAQTTPNPVTRESSFPIVGLAGSETAQIAVVNRANASSTGTAASCTGSISFVNASGAVIGTASNFTIGTGQIFTANLPFSGSGGTGNRTLVRGVVSLTTTPGAGVPCGLSATMETFDTVSGVTHVHLDSLQRTTGLGRY